MKKKSVAKPNPNSADNYRQEKILKPVSAAEDFSI